jgi:hypothetical protein
MEKNKLEEEIGRTLAGLDGMRRAEPSADFFEKLSDKMASPRGRVVPLKTRVIWRAAAGLALLALLNIFVWTRATAEGEETTANSMQTNPLAQDYFSYLSNLTLE